MKFEKFKYISQRKEWKSLTSKEPTIEICDIWEKYTLKPSEIKFLATLLEYDQVGITDKFNYYRTLTPGKQKANNLDMYILKYGEEYGRAKYESKVENSKNTLKRFIERHGEIVGREKYDNFRNVRRDHEQMMINKYGEVEGIRRHKHFCERNKGNHTLERKLEMYSEDEAYKKYNNFIDGVRKRHTLEGCIELYGEFEGPIKYYDKRLAIEFGASAEGYKLRYGDDYKEIMRKEKDNTSLESFIIRYGEVDGPEKFKKIC